MAQVCETVLLSEDGAIIGHQQQELGAEQVIELEYDKDLDEREAGRMYGHVQPRHCRLFRMGDDFYAWALESHGTLVDGQKCREQDGPVPLRDGTVIGIGKYLIFCEVATAEALQERRKRLLNGERVWKSEKGEPIEAVTGGEADPVDDEALCDDEEHPADPDAASGETGAQEMQQRSDVNVQNMVDSAAVPVIENLKEGNAGQNKRLPDSNTQSCAEKRCKLNKEEGEHVCEDVQMTDTSDAVGEKPKREMNSFHGAHGELKES